MTGRLTINKPCFRTMSMDVRILCTVLILALVKLTPATAAPQISSIKPVRSNSAVIQGQGFGQACRECEIIADFGDFKYAYTVESWNARRIVAKIADIGHGNRVRISVQTPTGTSPPMTYQIPIRQIPKRRLKTTVRPGSMPDLLLFEHRSNLTVGDKGEQQYDVSQLAPRCGQTGYVFDSANLVYGRDTRFGEAKFVALPHAGCSRCRPIRVRWYHEPTGKLHYQVHVYRREIEGICPAQVRR